MVPQPKSKRPRGPRDISIPILVAIAVGVFLYNLSSDVRGIIRDILDDQEGFERCVGGFVITVVLFGALVSVVVIAWRALRGAFRRSRSGRH